MFNILVLQIEDRTDNDFLNENMELNKKICSENDMQYKFLTKSLDNVPPYWAKVFDIDRIINNPNNSTIDYVFWIDSDAFFINFNKNRLNDFLSKYSEYSMIITKDPPPWKMQFNAGCFIVKNDSYSRQIFSYWKSLYNSNNWRIEDNKWKTDKQYAGDDYEQGAFATNILTKKEYSQHIKVVPYYILNNISCTENTSETIVSHLAGHYKNDMVLEADCKQIKYNNNNNKFYLWYFLLGLVLVFVLLLFLSFFMFYNKKMRKYFYKFCVVSKKK